ncbi:MAG TPA: DUF3987 domain-containing protein, partial [Anaerolineales bacterium]|nr:DUF3987 domain-containing protein [Anaerolineales bacterium]
DLTQAGQWLTDYITFASEASPMSAASFHEALGLTLIATAVARRVALAVSSKMIFTNLYVLIVALSTLYRKTTSYDVSRGVLRAAGLKHLLLPGRMSPESMLTELAGTKPPNFDGWDSESKADWRAERVFSAQRTWLMDEASSLFHSFEQKHTLGLLPIVLDLFECPADPPPLSTISRGRQTIRNAYINICGPTTPSEISKYLKSGDHWGNGMWARFIFVTPNTPPRWTFWPEKMGVPLSLSQNLRTLALEKLPLPQEDKLNAERIIPPEILSVEMEHGVWDRWEAYAYALENELLRGDQVPDRLYPNYGRFATIAIKVATLLATADWSMEDGQSQVPTLTNRHWARAQLLTESWRENLHRLYDAPAPMDEEEDLETRVLRTLTNTNVLLSERELARQIHMTRQSDRETLTRILQRMAEDGLIESVERPANRGRKGKCWQKAKNA